MATTTLPKSSPPFARLTEGRASNSWRRAIPVVVAIVGMIALLAYLASQLTSYSTRLAAAQRDAETSQQSVAAAQKRAVQLEAESNVLKSAGRTTVLLESADKSKSAAKKGAAPAAAASWAAATWGEGDAGKSWLRVSAYGLQAAPEGKSYGVWFTPLTGEPVLAGKLEPAADGSAFAMAKDLPGVDQGKLVAVSLDDAEAKAPGTALMSAELPVLKASKAAPATAAAAPADPATAPAAAAPAAGKTEALPAK